MVRFKNGDRACFIGDSITSQNRYVALITDHYKTNFPQEDIKIYNCGISGGTASLLLKYFDEDVLPHNPTHIFIMLGVNDSNCTLLGEQTIKERDSVIQKSYEDFKMNLSLLAERSEKIGAKVVLMTPPPYAEFQSSPVEAFKGGYDLIQKYAEFVKDLAKEKDYGCVDIHTFMTRQLQTQVLYNDDRIHPNDLGHYYIATKILETQKLNIGEFKDFSAYLQKWRQAVISYRGIYAVEHMVIKDDAATPKQKVEFIKNYLINQKYLNPNRTESVNLFFKKIAEEYVENKLNQSELYLQIDKFFDETKYDRNED